MNSSITFLSYDQVNQNIEVSLHDNRLGFIRRIITIDAIEMLLTKPEDELDSDVNRRIRSAILQKGGVEWINREIDLYQKKIMSGEE